MKPLSNRVKLAFLWVGVVGILVLEIRQVIVWNPTRPDWEAQLAAQTAATGTNGVDGVTNGLKEK